MNPTKLFFNFHELARSPNWTTDPGRHCHDLVLVARSLVPDLPSSGFMPRASGWRSVFGLQDGGIRNHPVL